MHTMRLRRAAFLLLLASVTAAAQTDAPPRVKLGDNRAAGLKLRWQLEEDVFTGSGEGSARASFTLTNQGKQAIPATGWALYFNALHMPREGSVGGGFRAERVAGDLLRFVPGPEFKGLRPGQSVKIEYLTGLLTNISFAPLSPYVVFEDSPDLGRPLGEFVSMPFARGPQGEGRDPRVITPAQQYALDSQVRDVPAGELPRVFPTAVGVEKRDGELRLQALPAVEAPAELRSEAAFASSYLAPYFDKTPAPPGNATVRLSTGPVEGQSSKEAYELEVDPHGIRIVGASPAGVFYGLQSLRTLLPAPTPGKGLVLDALLVRDAPRFGYRGFMLDVARNFQPKKDVLRVLDLMARYKLNSFHFHLTEDEGWRLEMPSLPELVSVGARRGHTLDSSRNMPPHWGSGAVPDKPWGSGHYTRAEYIEILRYAAARHIEVIPELEMPGHARAAVKAMEARFRERTKAGDAEGARRYLLSDPEDRSQYTSAQLYHDNVMNPTLESTYAFIERVVADLVATHKEAGVPLLHLHMGGDEVPNGVWQRSPAAQEYMKQKGLKSVDELWFVFYGRVEQILKAHGIPLSGWEEIAVRKTKREGQDVLVPNPMFGARGWRAYVWNNVPGWGAEDLAYRLANGGFEVVLCPVTNLYFDLAWNQNPEERGLDWGGFVDLRKPFQFVPYDYYRNVRLDRRGQPVDPKLFVGKERLTDYGRENIVGIQGNLWSETLGGEGRLERQLLPKLLGLAERAWAKDPAWASERDPAKAEALENAAWSEFVNVVAKRELPRLERDGYEYRIPTPGLKADGGQVLASLEFPGLTLRYTTDGSEPTAKSPAVTAPIPLRGTIRVAAFDGRGRKGSTATLAAP